MKHLTDGELQAYFDAALVPAEHARVRTHLDGCPTCETRATALSARTAQIRRQMEALAPPPRSHPLPPAVARARLDTYLNSKKEPDMLHKLFARRYRPIWGLVTLVLVLTLTFTLSPMRVLANRFLELFRIEKITFVEVKQENVPDEEQINAVSPELKALFGDTVHKTTEGERHEVDLAGARAEAGFPVRLPAGWDNAKLSLEPRGTIQARLDIPRLRALLQELDYTEIELPDSLNGSEITVQIPAIVRAKYNYMDPESRKISTVFFIQMRSPSISTSSNLDVAPLSKAYLQLLGMSPEEAEEFSRTIDWSTTLVMPQLMMDSMERQTVTVDGVQGTLFSHSSEEGWQLTELVWIKDGILHIFAANMMTTEELLQLVSTLQ